MTLNECKQKILEALYEFEDSNGVHITSIEIPTRREYSCFGASYEIKEPIIEYE